MNLDCTGQRCPQPVIELARAAKRGHVGDVIRITTDDPAAVIDIPAWCRMRGQQCDVVVETDGVVTHDVRLLH